MIAPPQVLVVVPTYNHENYIEDCLDSIEEQSYAYISVICIDDCSSDNTFNIVKRWSSLERSKDYHLYKNDVNYGLNNLFKRIAIYARNHQHDYIIFFSGDDIMIDKSKVSIQVDLMEITEACCCVTGYNLKTSDNIIKYSFYDYLRINPRGYIFPLSTTGFQPWLSNMVRSSAFFSIEKQIPRISFSDFALYILLVDRFGPPVFTNKIISTYRIHSTSAVSEFKIDRYIELFLWMLPKSCQSGHFYHLSINLFITLAKVIASKLYSFLFYISHLRLK